LKGVGHVEFGLRHLMYLHSYVRAHPSNKAQLQVTEVSDTPAYDLDDAWADLRRWKGLIRLVALSFLPASAS